MYQPDLNVVLAGDGTLNYASLIDDLTHNDVRLFQVSNHINSLTGPIIVLANRVEYLETLNKMYEGRSECLSGKSNNSAMKAFRKKALKMLDNNEIDCIFATYQLAKEGLDVPHLRYVVFATPEKDEVTVTQAAGRVGRKAEGKDFGTVIDFVDNFGMLQGYFKKRKRFYKKLEYEVVE
jgi:superfamily II DNA or RNA helicase